MNGLDTPFFQDDIAAIVRVLSARVIYILIDNALMRKLKVPIVQTLVLPKIHSTADLDKVSQTISQCFSSRSTKDPIRVVASIESARSLWSIGDIAGWKSREGVADVFALLVRVPFVVLCDILTSREEVCC